jgi:hypothetical protein
MSNVRSKVLHSIAWTITPCANKIDFSEYDAAREATVEVFSQSADFVSLVEYGSVSVPGLSDLDLIVGLVDQPSRGVSKSIRKAALPSSALRVMAYASLMIMPHSTLSKIRLWDDIEAKVVYGPLIEFRRYDGIHTKVARVVDWLPERICRIAEIFKSKTLNERKAIGLLKSTIYSLTIVEGLAGPITRVSSLRSEVEELRRRWFELPQPRWPLIVALLEDALIVSQSSWRRFVRWLAASAVYGNATKRRNQPDFRFPNHVTYQFNQSIRDGRSKSLYEWSTDELIFHLPEFLSCHFATYAAQDGPISSALRASISKVGEADAGDMTPYLIERISLCNQWAAFLQRNGFKNGLFKFGWFFG